MRIIDLTLPVTPQMPGVSIDVARRLDEDGWNASTLHLYSHSGTHMDAPCHFLPGGATIDRLDLRRIVGPALVVDLSPARPKQLLRVENFASVEKEISPGARLLLRTDWHRRYGTAEYRDALPRISLELAEWLVERRVALLGVEPPSVADVHQLEELTAVHRTLFKGDVVIVEGLAHLDRLTQRHVEFIALPLNVMGGDGTPVRAIAIERDADFGAD